MPYTIFPKPPKTMRGASGKELAVIVSENVEEVVASPVEYVEYVAPIIEEPEAESFDLGVSLGDMTKRELLAWSEEQGWDLINRQPKTAILEQCEQIALGTYQGKRLA